MNQPTANTGSGASPAQDRSGAPTRRQLLEAMGAAGLALTVGSLTPVSAGRDAAPDLAPYLPKLAQMRDAIAAPLRQRALGVGDYKLARPAAQKQDEYTYAVDVGQLLCYFASASEKEPYLALRDFAEKHLIVDVKADPFTKGFVLWRTRPGEAPDASGTTEALRLAKGLWTGARTFSRPRDGDLAMVVLDGYRQHQYVDQELWLIRNYFHFQSRAFATNSFIIDYDPDFLREVADAHRGGEGANAQRYKELTELADHSLDVLKASVTPCGLLYDLLQPELKTMYFGLNVAYFSPNDVIQLNNACATAATVTRGAAEVARGVLSFVTDRLEKLNVHYYGRTGEKVQNRGIGATEYCAIARLAAHLGDRGTVARCVVQAMTGWEWAVNNAATLDAWTASEMLLGLQTILAP